MLTLVVYVVAESWRFSRAAVLSMVLGHAVVHGWVMWRASKRNGHAHHRRLLVSDEDTERLIDLLRRNEGEYAIQRGRPLVEAIHVAQHPGVVLDWVAADLQEAVQIHNVEEVVFSADVEPCHCGAAHWERSG